MAKKTSATSKGYRKNVKKKPFLTKKEIVALIVIVVAIALVVVLFNLLYNPFIDPKDIQPDDIISGAGAETKNRYVRLGSVVDLDGYTRESTVSPDTPSGYNTYTPTDADDPLDHFSVSGASNTPATMLNSIASYYQYYSPTLSEVIETEVDGHAAYILGISVAYYDEEKDPDAEAADPDAAEPDAEAAEPDAAEPDAEAAEPEAAEPDAEAVEPEAAEEDGTDAAAAEQHAPNTYHQNISMYIVADDTHSIGVVAYRNGEDDSCYLPDDEIEAYMQKLAEAVVFPEK